MFRRFVTFIFTASLLFILGTSSVHAQIPAEMQTCLKSVNDWPNCEDYINKVISCLRTDIPYQRDTWACQDQNNDRKIDADDIKLCASSFPKTVCNNLGGIYGVGYRSCHDRCNESTSGYITAIQNLYKEKAYARYDVTPPVDTIDEADTCLKRIDKNMACSLVILNVTSCYKSTPAGDALWSCTKSDGTEADRAECKTLFFQRVENALNTVNDDKCKNLGTVLSAAELGERFDEVYTMRENKVVTPTPAVIPPTPTPVVPVGAADAGEVLNCGFSNADFEGKQKCCATNISSIEFSIPNDFNDCSWYDASCQISQRLQSYITDKARADMDESRTKYNQILSSNGGILPECFVGTCETRGGVRKCWPEKASAICERYIKDDDYDSYSKCDTCMNQNLAFGKANKYYSAIGCIDTSFEGIVAQVFTLGIGAAGMVALGCIIYSAFIMQTSMGNPEQLQKAQENITSCITGLILIILSIFILRILGVDILRIPGFGS